MEESIAECAGLFFDWVVYRPLPYNVFFFGACVFLLYSGIRKKDPTYFGWYAGWVVGVECWFGIAGITMMLDTMSHPGPSTFAFNTLNIFAAAWIRMSFLLWLGSLILLHKKLIGKMLGPIFAMMLLFSVGTFVLSTMLEYLVVL